MTQRWISEPEALIALLAEWMAEDLLLELGAPPQPEEAEMNKDYEDLTLELAAALGVPKGATRAVLTLEVGEPPRIEVTVYATDNMGNFRLEAAPAELGTGMAERLALVSFVVRLERATEPRTP
jgi:hypothetical protein